MSTPTPREDGEGHVEELEERVIEGIEEAHEDDFATKDEVLDAFLS